jgi:tRNA threonylcarbamoyladenosine biosynthesis protein TsaE
MPDLIGAGDGWHGGGVPSAASNSLRLYLPDSAATAALGEILGRELGAGLVYLYGDLGTGKTTLVRALLRARGIAGTVRSPTYTLVESYETAAGEVFHLDLYRLADAEELYFIGIDEVDSAQALTLVEWPQRGHGVLPAPDLVVKLTHCAVNGPIQGAEGVVHDSVRGRDARLEVSSDTLGEIITRIAGFWEGPRENIGMEGPKN